MKNTIKEVVAARFKAIREEKNVSQTQFASDLGYQTQSAYSKLELGKNAPSVKAYEEIAKKYKVRQAWLAFGDGAKYMTDDEYVKYMEAYDEEDDDDKIFIPLSKEKVKTLLTDLRNEFTKKIDDLLKQLE